MVWTEILAVVLCSCILVFAFIKIRTIRRSGYFTRVLELRPVSWFHDSSLRNSSISFPRSNWGDGVSRVPSIFA